MRGAGGYVDDAGCELLSCYDGIMTLLAKAIRISLYTTL